MPKVKTGIVMMNLGGPATLDQVQPFLLDLFADSEIIQLPFQRWLGPYLARRRTPKVQGLYASIGGAARQQEPADEQHEETGPACEGAHAAGSPAR